MALCNGRPLKHICLKLNFRHSFVLFVPLLRVIVILKMCVNLQYYVKLTCFILYDRHPGKLIYSCFISSGYVILNCWTTIFKRKNINIRMFTGYCSTAECFLKCWMYFNFILMQLATAQFFYIQFTKNYTDAILWFHLHLILTLFGHKNFVK